MSKHHREDENYLLRFLRFIGKMILKLIIIFLWVCSKIIAVVFKGIEEILGKYF